MSVQLGVDIWAHVLKQLIVGLEYDGVYCPSVVVRYICTAARASKDVREASYHALAALSGYLPKLRDAEIWSNYFCKEYRGAHFIRSFDHELRQCRIASTEYRECFGRRNISARHRADALNVVMWVHIEHQAIPEKLAVVIGRFFPDTFLNSAYIQRLWFCFKFLHREFDKKSAAECAWEAARLFRTSPAVIQTCYRMFITKKKQREKMKSFLKARPRLYPNIHLNLIFTWFEISIPRVECL